MFVLVNYLLSLVADDLIAWQGVYFAKLLKNIDVSSMLRRCDILGIRSILRSSIGVTLELRLQV